jgi:hypothetical protein
MLDLTMDLFTSNTTRPGSLDCRAEIAATMLEAMKRAAETGTTREEIAARMSVYLGEKISVGTLNGYVAPSHTSHAAENGAPARDISLMRAMAFDAAVEKDVLLSIFTRKRGDRVVISNQEGALLEWAKLHREEKALGERKKLLEAAMKVGGERK